MNFFEKAIQLTFNIAQFANAAFILKSSVT